MYAMDKPMTILHSYDLQGQDLDSGTLKDGYGTWKEFDDNGKLVEMTTYEKGKKVKRVKY
jgi:antitoxin component YwqK of YwqJK toxin-antitoxin module